MKTVLITGGDGYIASSLYNTLSDSYSITRLTRQDVNLLNSVAVNNWLSGKYFDAVIHTAITGGSRLKEETVSVVDNNLRMYYNLLDNKERFGRFINIGSGAELYQTHTPYGLSKHVIRQSILEKDGFYNIRVFAVFDENELDTRFIKANLKRYIQKEPMQIYSNRRMDFFYMKDFIKLVEYYLTSSTELRKEIDCVYTESKLLNDIAKIINKQSSYEVEIKVLSEESELDYIGTYSDIGISYDGLDKGIEVMYNKLLSNF